MGSMENVPLTVVGAVSHTGVCCGLSVSCHGHTFLIKIMRQLLYEKSPEQPPGGTFFFKT